MTSADFNMGRVRGLHGRVSGMHRKHRLGVLERQVWKDQHGSAGGFPAEAKADSCLSHTVLALSLMGGAGQGGIRWLSDMPGPASGERMPRWKWAGLERLLDPHHHAHSDGD